MRCVFAVLLAGGIVTGSINVIRSLCHQMVSTRVYINTDQKGGLIVGSSKNTTYSALHLDELKLAIPALMVQLRLPVVALVEMLVARRGPGLAGLLVGQVEGKPRAANNGVHMGGDDAGEDDGIAAVEGQRRAVDREQLGDGAWRQGRGDGNGRLDTGRHHGEV